MSWVEGIATIVICLAFGVGLCMLSSNNRDKSPDDNAHNFEERR